MYGRAVVKSVADRVVATPKKLMSRQTINSSERTSPGNLGLFHFPLSNQTVCFGKFLYFSRICSRDFKR